jgi:hypothetical protein
MSDSSRKIHFKYLGTRFSLEIPTFCELVINLYPQIIKQCNLDAGANIKLFATLVTGTQHIFQPQESIDSFIEKSKGGIVTIYVKTPAPQRVLEQSSVDRTTRLRGELKPNEELHMANRGPSTHTVIEGKKALLTGGLTIDLGCGASVHIPEGHELLNSGKKLGFQHIKPNSNTYGGISPMVKFELLDE